MKYTNEPQYISARINIDQIPLRMAGRAIQLLSQCERDGNEIGTAIEQGLAEARKDRRLTREAIRFGWLAMLAVLIELRSEDLLARALGIEPDKPAGE
jgi:hypothetical protein